VKYSGPVTLEAALADEDTSGTKDSLGASGGVDVSKATPAWKGRMVGHFKLISILGQGAMGKVFRAEDISLKRHVALKVLPQKVTQGNKTYKLDQFYREARSAATLEHPHVVTIYEVNSISGVYYIAMELIEGGNLDDLVKASGPMDAVRASQLCAEAAEALYYGHQHGIIHRDVKPSNLMLTRGGRCKLADFGLAHIDDPNDPFSLPTEAVGTPQFVAPEVAQGSPATALSDVYSLGATMYYLLAGTPPYVAPTKKELLRMHVNAPVPDLKDKRPDVPESLNKAIRTAMAKDPAERHASADVFAKVLRAHTIPVGTMSNLALSGSLGGRGMSGAHSGQFGVVDLKAARNKNILTIGAAISLGALVVCAIFAVVNMRDHRPQYAAPLPPTPLVSKPLAKAPDVAVPAPAPTKTPEPVKTPEVVAPTTPAPATPAPVIPATPTTNQAIAAAAPSEGKIYTPDDFAALHDLASAGQGGKSTQSVTIEGTVAKAETSTSGKVAKYILAGTGDKSIQVVYFTRLFDQMQQTFGGKNGAGLVNKKIRVTGPVQIYQGDLEVIVNSVDQVKPTD
jgi:eukaryotic-like serine/threonine-protein kinase